MIGAMQRRLKTHNVDGEEKTLNLEVVWGLHRFKMKCMTLSFLLCALLLSMVFFNRPLA
jgi:hypothetical protein